MKRKEIYKKRNKENLKPLDRLLLRMRRFEWLQTRHMLLIESVIFKKKLFY